MKSFTYVAICLLLAMISASLRQDEQEQKHIQWLEGKYAEARLIKEGMTRADLLKSFEEDGGIQRVLAERYVLKSCKMIKLDIQFNAENGAGYVKRPDAELIITRVSTPYLEYKFMD